LVRGGKTPVSASIPFVILTGECRENKVVEALAEGASSYIVKPISAKLLMTHLVKLVLNDREKYEFE
jgi:DNA-binding response OmpR family regulator